MVATTSVVNVRIVDLLLVLLIAAAECEHHVLAGARLRLIHALAEQTVAADCDCDVLLAANRVHSRYAFRRGRKIVAPQYLAGVGVVRAELAIRRRADEQQAAARRDDAAARRVTSRARDSFLCEARDVAVRDLPKNRALVQVVRRDL